MTQTTGLLASVRSLLGTLLGMARTRLELIAIELEEERIHLAKLVAYGLLALFFFGLGVIVLSVLVMAVFWESHRLAAIAGLALVYLGVALAFGISARQQLRRKPRLFSATLAEIDKDRTALANYE